MFKLEIEHRLKKEHEEDESLSSCFYEYYDTAAECIEAMAHYVKVLEDEKIPCSTDCNWVLAPDNDDTWLHHIYWDFTFNRVEELGHLSAEEFEDDEPEPYKAGLEFIREEMQQEIKMREEEKA